MATAEEKAAAAAATDFITEVWSLQGVAYLVVGLRYFARLRTVGWRGLAWDDGLMGLATLVYTAESVMAYMVVAYWEGLANNAMTDAQRAALDPDSREWMLRVNGSKTHITGLLLYTTLMWILKACWLVYYGRMTDGVHGRRHLVRIGAGFVAVTYVACLLVAFLKCIPFDHQWQINPSPGNSCMPAISSIQTIFVMVMNTVTDLYLMGIPIPVIWGSHLPLRKKLALLTMFSGGILEMVFGMLRCISILTLGNIDPAQSGYWSVRESFVSVVLTNLPMIYPLVRSCLGAVTTAYASSRGYGTNTKGGSKGFRSNNVVTIGGGGGGGGGRSAGGAVGGGGKDGVVVMTGRRHNDDDYADDDGGDCYRLDSIGGTSKGSSEGGENRGRQVYIDSEQGISRAAAGGGGGGAPAVKSHTNKNHKNNPFDAVSPNDEATGSRENIVVINSNGSGGDTSSGSSLGLPRGMIGAARSDYHHDHHGLSNAGGPNQQHQQNIVVTTEYTVVSREQQQDSGRRQQQRQQMRTQKQGRGRGLSVGGAGGGGTYGR